jgi:hypothetical protein
MVTSCYCEGPAVVHEPGTAARALRWIKLSSQFNLGHGRSFVASRPGHTG